MPDGLTDERPADRNGRPNGRPNDRQSKRSTNRRVILKSYVPPTRSSSAPTRPMGCMVYGCVSLLRSDPFNISNFSHHRAIIRPVDATGIATNIAHRYGGARVWCVCLIAGDAEAEQGVQRQSAGGGRQDGGRARGLERGEGGPQAAPGERRCRADGSQHRAVFGSDARHRNILTCFSILYSVYGCDWFDSCDGVLWFDGCRTGGGGKKGSSSSVYRKMVRPLYPYRRIWRRSEHRPQ